jgi:hypothetical protein
MKSVRIPYKKVQNFVLIKQIDYDYRKKYKKITYCYDEYKDEVLVKTYTHRINNPAVVIYRNNHINELQYWKFGKLHREYAPAIIIYDGNKIDTEKWYHNGVKLTDLEIEAEKKIIDRRQKMLKVILKIKKKQQNKINI